MDRIRKGSTELLNEKWMEIIQKIIKAAKKTTTTFKLSKPNFIDYTIIMIKFCA